MLGIVLINYKSEKEVISFLENEISKIKYPYKIVIVNNSSSNKDDDFLTKNLANNSLFKFNESVFLLNADSNLGYAKANNLGAEFLIRKFKVKYLLFSNNDIQINKGTDINLLISRLKSSKQIGGIGPRVIGKDDNDQSPHQYISFYRYFGWILFKPLKGKVPIIQKDYKTQKVPEQTARTCYWVSGCFMILKAEEFVLAGKFDPFTFLYCEEKILAERFLKIGLHFIYEPSTIVYHHQDDSYTINRKREIADLIFKNDCYYYKTYRNVPGLMIWFLSSIRKIRKKILK